jgi:hypothetical protein
MHVYCIRHIAKTFIREISDKTLRKKIVNIGMVYVNLTIVPTLPKRDYIFKYEYFEVDRYYFGGEVDQGI